MLRDLCIWITKRQRPWTHEFWTLCCLSWHQILETHILALTRSAGRPRRPVKMLAKKLLNLLTRTPEKLFLLLAQLNRTIYASRVSLRSTGRKRSTSSQPKSSTNASLTAAATWKIKGLKWLTCLWARMGLWMLLMLRKQFDLTRWFALWSTWTTKSVWCSQLTKLPKSVVPKKCSSTRTLPKVSVKFQLTFKNHKLIWWASRATKFTGQRELAHCMFAGSLKLGCTAKFLAEAKKRASDQAPSLHL